LLISSPTLSELYEVLTRRRFRRYVDEGDIRQFLVALAREAEWIVVRERISVCRDPKDDKFLELAVAGRASNLVTGDEDLLVLDPFRGVRILSPQALLDANR